MCFWLRQAGDFLFKIGLAGAAQGALTRWALGYAAIHPGYFVSALVSSMLVKYQAENMQKTSFLQHIDLMTEHFALVTSNLLNQYHTASETTACSFVERDPQKVHDAIAALIEGQNKSNAGTLQKFFDQRDLQPTKLKMNELKISGTAAEGDDDPNDESWVDVTRD